MDAPPPFSDREIAFLDALVAEGVDFLIVGLAAAALQGAPAVTQDVDLWFRDLMDPRFSNALRRAGASYIPPAASTPPLLAGAGTELFDVVVHMHGLGSFDVEAARAISVPLGQIEVRVLPLERIIVSKRATGRPKDLSILPALEDALRAHRRQGS
ncbi:MAG: nucleotidyltransferase [Acidobacteriota bacterium]